MNKKPILGLTMGDPAGIGPEICLQVMRHDGVRVDCVPVLFGDASVLDRLQSSSFFQFPEWANGKAFETVSLVEFDRLGEITEPLVVDCAAINCADVIPGKVSPACGRAAYKYIGHAIEAAVRGKIHGVVTAPIHKEAISMAGIKFPGHTEIFSALTGAKRSCMMLYSDKLTVSMATTHIGYCEVPGKLLPERVLAVIELTAEAMRQILGREPVLGVCGLNPHAGEHGLFGKREEELCVEPAIRMAHERGMRVEGPLVPDAAFTVNVRKRFDAIVTLYHDQGHIPFKMLAFDTGVNITLGLPIIRTSVDHGTAFDIAWQNKASATSMFSAIEVAANLARRKVHEPEPVPGLANCAARTIRNTESAG